MIRLSKAPGFDKEDAGIVAAILYETDTSNPENRKATIVQLKDIYGRYFHELKKEQEHKSFKDILGIYICICIYIHIKIMENNEEE